MKPDSIAHVRDRIDYLRQRHEHSIGQRNRIRAILNGGPGAVRALLGPKVKEMDVPAAPFIESGLQRLSQKLGRRPDVKVDARKDKDSLLESRRAEKRERIVEGYDQNGDFELTLPKGARHLVGYGFAVWVVKSRYDMDTKAWYPSVELRDSYDCYPGYSGVGWQAQPDELAIARRVDREWLRKKYPQYDEDVKSRSSSLSYSSPLAITRSASSIWDTNAEGTVVVEYFDLTGTWMIAAETGTLLEFSPNPLRVPRFVMAKRYSFDEDQGHYDQVLGLYKMIAQMNMMAVIATQDATFKEINVVGRLTSGKYRKGRNAVNYFEPGSSISKPSGDVAYQTFQHLNVLERYLRVGANYSTAEDGQAPSSWTTGQGLDRLGQPGDNNVTEYQLSLRHAIQRLDSTRLRWDDTVYPQTKKPLIANIGGKAIDETYKPSKDIAGHYRTRRVYGVMAGWDEPSKVVTGLQLLQGRIIDRRTMQENLYGLENANLVNERIDRDDAYDRIMAMLSEAANQGDPAARMALIEIGEKPKEKHDILRKFFTPEEPQMSPEEEQMAMMAGGAPQGSPESVATVLSRLESSGAAEGGVQTVGRLPGA